MIEGNEGGGLLRATEFMTRKKFIEENASDV
jgi:hypothetical protein